jgi:broad-specificity NMP kinase
MSFIYVTGAPGTGKSTLQRLLSTHKLEVHDIDDSTLGGAHNKASGKRVAIPPAQDRAPEWYDLHEWRVDSAAIKSLRDKAVDSVVIICGVAPDDGDILHLFDKIFYLKLGEDALKDRIAARTDNDYGKNLNELTDILERKNKLDARYMNSDAFTIDASLSPGEIADQILSQIK